MRMSSSIRFTTPASIPDYTIDNGIYTTNTTLPIGNYTVNSDMTVREGATLTLTPGSTFSMADRCSWNIIGAIRADGNASNRIVFQKQDAATRWHGIRICYDTPQTTSTATFRVAEDDFTTGFGLNVNWPVFFTTTGTLPAGINPNQYYYILASSQIATRMGGTPITIADTGTGTHTAHRVYPNETDPEPDDKDLAQSITYCDFSDAKKNDLTNYGLAFRQWQRGGAIFAYQVHDFTLNNCTFTDCTAVDRGGAVYVQGEDSYDTYTYTNLTFTNCTAEDELAGAFAQSHGNQGVQFINCTWTNSTATNYQGKTFTVDASTNVVTFSGLSTSLVNGALVDNLSTTGTLPSGLSASTKYYIINASGSTCKLATTYGGTEIDITDTGSGTHTADTLNHYYVFDATIEASS